MDYKDENRPRYEDDDFLLAHGDTEALLSLMDRTPEITGNLRIILMGIMKRMEEK